MQERDFIRNILILKSGVFTIQDAAKVLGSTGPGLKIYLQRLVGRDVITRIERGKYCLAGTPPEVIATNVVIPSYISFLWALSFHRLSTQMPSVITTVGLRRHDPLRAGNVTVQFMVMKSGRFFGMAKHKASDGAEFMVAEPEKAVIDALCYPAHCPVSEVIDSLKLAVEEEQLNVNLLVDNTLRMGSNVGTKRLGYLLDSFGIDPHDRLSSLVNDKYDPLDPSLPKKGRYIKKWKIVVNTEG
jgi:predicted transcriptional regulator of viral defense system